MKCRGRRCNPTTEKLEHACFRIVYELFRKRYSLLAHGHKTRAGETSC